MNKINVGQLMQLGKYPYYLVICVYIWVMVQGIKVYITHQSFWYRDTINNKRFFKNPSDNWHRAVHTHCFFDEHGQFTEWLDILPEEISEQNYM